MHELVLPMHDEVWYWAMPLALVKAIGHKLTYCVRQLLIHFFLAASRNIAQCSFQLQGQHQITDITVRGFRQPGMTNTCLYNSIGPGEWKVIDCTAMFPSGGVL